jgi:hypothetical protein
MKKSLIALAVASAAMAGSAYAANLLVFDASKGVHFHDEVFKDTVYFMNNVFCNTSTTPTQWYRKTDALAKAAFSNNDYYEAGGKASRRIRANSTKTADSSAVKPTSI